MRRIISLGVRWVLFRGRLYGNGLMAVGVSLLDNAHPTPSLHIRRHIDRSVFAAQVERFGGDNLAGYGDLNGLAGFVAFDLP